MSLPILEEHKFINVGNSSFVANQEDVFASNPSTDVVSLAEWETCVFVIQKGAGTAGTATITVESCDDVTPTTTTAVAFKYRANTSGDTWGAWTEATSAGFATTAGANQMYEIAIDADQLDDTDSYVRLQVTEVDSTACDGAILAVLFGPKYARSIPNTSLV